jgi:hypothetical protein
MCLSLACRPIRKTWPSGLRFSRSYTSGKTMSEIRYMRSMAPARCAAA